MSKVILIGFGGNLSGPGGRPEETFTKARTFLMEKGISFVRFSPLYKTSPVPRSSQPDYVNGVACIDTSVGAEQLLMLLHETEEYFGRNRKENSLPNAPRPLDLDLLDYRGEIRKTGPLLLPHPRLHERAFVLYPLRDVAPDWRHPLTHQGLEVYIARLDPDQDIERLTELP